MTRWFAAFGVASVIATSLQAQSAPSTQPAALALAPGGATFDVVSVKPSNPEPGNPLSAVPMAMPPVGGRFTATNIPLRMLVRIAYDVQDFQIVGGPSWQLSANFDVHAKTEDGFTGGMRETLPMLKALLADRFKLKVHMEQREMPISALVIARSDGRLGPDIKRSTADCPSEDALVQKQAEAIAKGDAAALMAVRQNATCTIAPLLPTGSKPAFGFRASGQPIAPLTHLLTQMTGRVVEDRTGLEGLYDWTLTFDPQVLTTMAGQIGMSIPPGTQFPASDAPSLLTAIQEQLGLKLNAERAQVDVVVIDSAVMPTID